MIELILRLVVAALLALTGFSAEDETLSLEGVVIDECTEGINCNDGSTAPPSELPGPPEGGPLR